MIKKMRSSLTVKIFLITGIMLGLACVLTYSFIAWYMPITYTGNIDDELELKTQKLVQKLEQTTLENCGGLLDRYMLDTRADVTVLDAVQNTVELPISSIVTDQMMMVTDDVAYLQTGSKTQTKGHDETINETITVTEGSKYLTMDSEVQTERNNGIIYDTTIVLNTTNEYPFIFSDSSEQYTLIVSGSMQAVNQAAHALQSVLPWLILVVILISLLGALFYSWYVTRPIVKISGISKRMSNLEFNWYCEDNRNDEIGVLSRSLNDLSERLSTALADLRQANTTLKDDIDKERRLERKRLEFFSAVSHELKTPITIMKGQLEGMIQHIGVYKDRDKYLARTLTVAEKLEAMVLEILAISRMEFSGFLLHKKDFNFTDLVHRQLADCTELLQQRELTLHVNIEEHIFVHADQLLIQKVLVNLISNAAKYSLSGKTVYVKVQRKEDVVLFTIENTSLPIPDEALSRLFEAFFRVEQSRSRQTGGSGLGLYIVKMILDQHDATYSIENTASGVRFMFTLCVARGV